MREGAREKAERLRLHERRWQCADADSTVVGLVVIASGTLDFLQ